MMSSQNICLCDSCGSQNNVLLNQGIHVLSPRTCEYVTLRGKRDFPSVTKGLTVTWGDDSGLSRWSQFNDMSPQSRVPFSAWVTDTRWKKEEVKFEITETQSAVA